MVNYAYEVLCRYFNRLCNVGFAKDEDVNTVLILTTIQKLVDCDFRGHLTEDDYNKINSVLFKLYGTTCLAPYPDYYSNKDSRIMYTCSISELANRVTRLEEEGTGGTSQITGIDGSGETIVITNKPIVVPTTSIATVTVDLNALDDETGQ